MAEVAVVAAAEVEADPEVAVARGPAEEAARGRAAVEEASRDPPAAVALDQAAE